jgi:serine/threonine protein kinase
VPKTAGLPIDVGGERACKLLHTILYFLDHDFPDRGHLAKKYVFPLAVEYGFSKEPISRLNISEATEGWFAGLAEPQKIKFLRLAVKELLTNSTDFTKNIILKVLKKYHLRFLQGSFFDTRIKVSEYRTAFHAYQADKQVGEGGNGTVWQVRRDDNQPLAMKVLSKVDLQSSRRKRFSNELWFCAQNDHPNIIKVLDWGLSTVGGEPFYVMPLLDGSLRKLIGAGIDPDRVPRLFLAGLAGVAAAHKQKIWHRDLKPENLLYDKKSDALVVADFGIAHFTVETMKAGVKTQRGAWVANKNYAAPEQRRKNAPVDYKADIFALGMILNEMFTGELALGSGYKRIKTVAPAYAHLDDLVDKMTDVTTSKRPSIEDIRVALEQERRPVAGAGKKKSGAQNKSRKRMFVGK